jgi:3-methyladenine DNA glycosylase AlkC
MMNVGILNLSTRCRRTANFMSRSLYSRGSSLQFPMEKRKSRAPDGNLIPNALSSHCTDRALPAAAYGRLT